MHYATSLKNVLIITMGGVVSCMSDVCMNFSKAAPVFQLTEGTQTSIKE